VAFFKQKLHAHVVAIDLCDDIQSEVEAVLEIVRETANPDSPLDTDLVGSEICGCFLAVIDCAMDVAQIPADFVLTVMTSMSALAEETYPKADGLKYIRTLARLRDENEIQKLFWQLSKFLLTQCRQQADDGVMVGAVAVLLSGRLVASIKLFREMKSEFRLIA
jgi:hypothetical protein